MTLLGSLSIVAAAVFVCWIFWRLRRSRRISKGLTLEKARELLSMQAPQSMKLAAMNDGAGVSPYRGWINAKSDSYTSSGNKLSLLAPGEESRLNEQFSGDAATRLYKIADSELPTAFSANSWRRSSDM